MTRIISEAPMIGVDPERMRAEAELLGLLRHTDTGFALTITRTKRGWSITTADEDGKGSARGKGESFAAAWRRQQPVWTRAGEGRGDDGERS